MTMSVATTSNSSSTSDVRSHVLGNLQVPEEQCFVFSGGLLGLPACTRFALLPAERSHFYWLQSLDCDSLTFLLVDPFHVVEEFYVDIPEGDLGPLQADQTSQVGVLAIVTLPRSPGDAPTVNLQGLITLNFAKRLGRQIIIQDSPYGVNWALDLQRLNRAS